MPVIVRGNQPNKKSFGEQKYSYRYPNDLDLRPGSKLHDDLVEMVMSRARISFENISTRHDSWNDIDKTLTVYKVVDTNEEEVQESDERRPVSIVFPYSYAVMETILTYLVVTFLRDPVFSLKGTGPEDQLGALLLEEAIQHQVYRGKTELALHTFFRDSMAYGMGALTPVWEKWHGIKRKWTNTEFGKKTIKEDGIVFEGNVSYNIDPYRLLPDPNVPIHKSQKGEFIGWLDSDNLMNLLKKESLSDTSLFNIKYLKGIEGNRTSIYGEDKSARQAKTGTGQGDVASSVTNRIDIIYMYIELIPSDCEIANGEVPEKWLLGVAADSILVMLERADQEHGQYPVVIGAPDFDGYSTCPTSRLEILYGLQHVLDFMFNSHVSNVRKAVNDMLVVDPYMINVKDVEDPKEGKIIRLRKPAWGRGVKDAIMQLNINDITRANIADADWIVQFINRIGAVDDSLMGVLRSGGPERLTGSEFSGTRNSAVSRLQRIARVLSIQAMHDLGFMYASHTQQYMTETNWMEITGERSRRLAQLMGMEDIPMKGMMVGPEELSVNFDMVLKDGTAPWNNTEGMMKVFETLTKAPETAAGFDMFRIFSLIAMGWGVQNIDDLRKKQQSMPGVQSSVLPDGQIQKLLQAGNVVPMPGMGVR